MTIRNNNTENPVIIFDIEASCDDRDINPHYNMETIEIGAVKVLNGKVIDEFETFVRPEYINDLTPFCKKLTGITYADLEDAPLFNEAILDFYSFIYGDNIYSCGEFDRKFLTREINDKGTDYTHELAKNAINSSHTDLKKLYSQITGQKKQGMTGMLNYLNVKHTGDHHRALADSRNLADIYIKLEDIRQQGLEELFSGDRMTRLVKSINDNHGNCVFVKESESGLDVCYKDNDKTEELRFIDFMDSWSDTFITDVIERSLGYLNRQELSAIRRFTK